ncbi:hypothetical protein COT65_01435 [Candidatus Shapirobacteria bacterium CG09_land_8_20_14_0_10_47_13]|uniref:Uncharacterized protein n=1 Tax=Candidatus Shapirobacteria bacterium CG09_land_8_20_14_0_10_47_13 TaxID=1974481 RepID=A0A2H0WMS2_9BACT|nr:MAG: hypothetical protein COT65_01435 [Candidatus Shapirobacteria bacterium CG09_land_8_20_14_0_10_47_13]
MPREREFPPASGEQKQHLVVKCESLLAVKTLTPTAFGRFLDHLFVLMGSVEGIETPELTDRLSKKPYAISLGKRDSGVVVHILPATRAYEEISMGEMVFLDNGKACIERFPFNNRTGQEFFFASYLDGQDAHFDNDVIASNTAAELTPRQLKTLTTKIFTAWQKSQDMIK